MIYQTISLAWKVLETVSSHLKPAIVKCNHRKRMVWTAWPEHRGAHALISFPAKEIPDNVRHTDDVTLH